MQPTYLPWPGYFNLIASVEDFVFLDDVQFERRSWQSRNRILLRGAEHMLSVPVSKAGRETRLCDIRVADEDRWRSSHSAVLQQAYERAPYGAPVLDAVLPCIADRAITHLAALNIRIIEALCRLLGLSPRLHRASDLGCGGRRSEHLALICERLGQHDYLAPAGSREYLEADDFEERFRKRLRVQAFESRPYPQRGAIPFVSHLSVVDLLAQTGMEAASRYVRGAS